MASPSRWTWIWGSSRSWTGRPGMLQSRGLQKARYDWATELNWCYIRASLVAQTMNNPPAMRETWVWSLGWEDPLKEGMTTHSSILAWRIPMDRGAWWDTVHGVEKSQHGWATKPQPMSYMKVVQRVNPKSSYHKEKLFFSFTLYLYEVAGVH